MKNLLIPLFFIVLIIFDIQAQERLDEILPVRGICMSVPTREGVDKFVNFITNELVPMNVNTLVILIDYKYEYKSHPELVGDNALSKQDVKKIVKACKGKSVV